MPPAPAGSASSTWLAQGPSITGGRDHPFCLFVRDFSFFVPYTKVWLVDKWYTNTVQAILSEWNFPTIFVSRSPRYPKLANKQHRKSTWMQMVMGVNCTTTEWNP